MSQDTSRLVHKYYTVSTDNFAWGWLLPVGETKNGQGKYAKIHFDNCSGGSAVLLPLRLVHTYDMPLLSKQY